MRVLSYQSSYAKDFTLGLTDGFKMLAVETFYFQRSEQSLAGRITPAVALAAHRSGDAEPLKQSTELSAGVLAAAIAMEDMTCASVVTAPEPGHLQCVDDQIAVHLRLHRQADHPSAEQVDDHGQIQPALVGWDVGNVAGPPPIGGRPPQSCDSAGSVRSASRVGCRWW